MFCAFEKVRHDDEGRLIKTENSHLINIFFLFCILFFIEINYNL